MIRVEYFETRKTTRKPTRLDGVTPTNNKPSMQQEAEKINIKDNTSTRSPVTRTGKNNAQVQARRNKFKQKYFKKLTVQLQATFIKLGRFEYQKFNFSSDYDT